MRIGGNVARLRALAPVWPIPSGDPSPVPSVPPLKLGPNGLSAPGPGPPVVFGWPSVDPSIGPSAFPSSQDDRAPVDTPARACHSTTPRPLRGPITTPTRRHGPVPSTKPLNLKPSSTGARPVPLDGHSDRPWDRPLDGPKFKPSGDDP
jgi:hypothetical protein